MFKKFLIISLLIPAYNFSSDSLGVSTEREKKLMNIVHGLLTEQERRLERTIDECSSDRDSSRVWGGVQGVMGCSLLGICSSTSGVKKNSENGHFVELLSLGLLSFSALNLVWFLNVQDKINSDSQSLLKTQAELRDLNAMLLGAE